MRYGVPYSGYCSSLYAETNFRRASGGFGLGGFHTLAIERWPNLVFVGFASCCGVQAITRSRKGHTVRAFYGWFEALLVCPFDDAEWSLPETWGWNETKQIRRRRRNPRCYTLRRAVLFCGLMFVASETSRETFMSRTWVAFAVWWKLMADATNFDNANRRQADIEGFPSGINPISRYVASGITWYFIPRNSKWSRRNINFINREPEYDREHNLSPSSSATDRPQKGSDDLAEN